MLAIHAGNTTSNIFTITVNDHTTIIDDYSVKLLININDMHCEGKPLDLITINFSAIQ